MSNDNLCFESDRRFVRRRFTFSAKVSFVPNNNNNNNNNNNEEGHDDDDDDDDKNDNDNSNYNDYR